MWVMVHETGDAARFGLRQYGLSVSDFGRGARLARGIGLAITCWF
jgi:hypothetical protein